VRYLLPSYAASDVRRTETSNTSLWKPTNSQEIQTYIFYSTDLGHKNSWTAVRVLANHRDGCEIGMTDADFNVTPGIWKQGKDKITKVSRVTQSHSYTVTQSHSSHGCTILLHAFKSISHPLYTKPTSYIKSCYLLHHKSPSPPPPQLSFHSVMGRKFQTEVGPSRSSEPNSNRPDCYLPKPHVNIPRTTVSFTDLTRESPYATWWWWWWWWWW
jgi:hypothetical protein